MSAPLDSVPWRLEVGTLPVWSNTLWVLLLIHLLAACASRETGPDVVEVQVSGPRVSRVNFSGNDSFGAGTLRGAMNTKGKPFLQFWKKGEPYDPLVLEDDLLRLRKFYFDRGFLSTQVELAKVEESAEDETVAIEITVDEGPRTMVESIGLAGVVPPEFSDQSQLLSELALLPGDPLNREAFEKSLSALVRKLQNRGFARAEVVPATEVDEATHAARITFTLQPGEKVNFGEITVARAKQVKDYVVTRQLSISEGDPYNGNRVQDSQEDIFDLDLFRAVTPRIKNMEEEGAPVDIEFELTERKPRTGRLGVGVSSIESVRYMAEWTHRNLFSEAETLKLGASVSRYFQTLEAELHEPYFFNRKTSTTYKLFGISHTTITTDPTGIVRSIFDLEDPFPAYDFLLGGGEWRVEHDFTRKLGGVVGLNFTSTDYYNVDKDAGDDLLDGVEDNKLFIQFLEGEWNARNSDVNPRWGQLLRAKLEHSNDKAFSDSSFVKVGLDGRHYFPITQRSVLASRLKIGAIKAYGGTDTIPSNVRFYAGGPGSVRGYTINRLGPLDSNGNPIGGNSLIEGSVELRFPIAGALVGNAFVDAGNVYQPEFTYHLGDLKYSIGAGIGYNTPVGPLRLEVAIAIDPDENDITSPVIFSIGHAF